MAKNFRVTKTRPVLCHWCQLQAIQGSGMVLNLTGRDRFITEVAYESTPADHEHFDSLAWPCMIARWRHRRHKHSHVPFFCCLFGRLPVWISTLNLRIHQRVLGRKNLSDQRLRIQSLWFWSAVFLQLFSTSASSWRCNGHTYNQGNWPGSVRWTHCVPTAWRGQLALWRTRTARWCRWSLPTRSGTSPEQTTAGDQSEIKVE